MINYEELDPGIRRTVQLLNEAGYETSDSGDGSKAGDMECAVDYPMIVIPVLWDTDGPRVAMGVYEFLVHRCRKPGLFRPGHPNSIQVEYNYLPYYGFGTVQITGFLDKYLRSELTE